MCPAGSVTPRVTSYTTARTPGVRLTYFHTCVRAHGAFKWLLVSVFVTPVPDEFSTGDKCHITVHTLVRPGSYKVTIQIHSFGGAGEKSQGLTG